MKKLYTATFTPGRFDVVDGGSLPGAMSAGAGFLARKWWMITKDGQPFCFAFDAESATMTCIALNIAIEMTTGSAANVGRMIDAVKTSMQVGTG